MKAGDGTMTFIDTPGHAAFSKMRLRGTQVADIVILVIAADSGIQDQTEEVIRNIQETAVPFIVALNKCDKDNANPDKVIEQLLTRGIVVEEKGGNIQCARISAKEGEGIEELIQCLQIQSEFDNEHLFVNQKAAAEAYILDVFKEKGHGVCANALVYTGTLKPGDVFVCGTTWGKVKSIIGHDNKSLPTGLPSIPINIVGFKGEDLPQPGDELIVVPKEKFAQEVVNYRKQMNSTEGQEDLITNRVQTLNDERRRMLLAAREGLDQVRDFLEETKSARHFNEEHDNEKTINVIIRADVPGSIEGLESAISEIPAERFGFDIEIMSAKIGPLSEADVDAAKSANAYLLSFNQKTPHSARVLNSVRRQRRQLQVAHLASDV